MELLAKKNTSRYMRDNASRPGARVVARRSRQALKIVKSLRNLTILFSRKSGSGDLSLRPLLRNA
jgi:hypothetical protein